MSAPASAATAWQPSLAQLRSHPIAATLAAAWEASRVLTFGGLVVTVTLGILPNLVAVGVGNLIAVLTRLSAVGHDDGSLGPAIAILTIPFLLIQVLNPVGHYAGTALGRRMDASLQLRTMTAVLGPLTIDHLDHPDVREGVALAREWETSAHPPHESIEALLEFTYNTVWGLGSVALLFAYVWWGPIILAAGWGAIDLWGSRSSSAVLTSQSSRATALRRSAYVRDLAFAPSGGRESRVFGLGDWLRRRSHDDWRGAMVPLWQERASTRAFGWFAVALLLGGYVLVFGTIADAAVAGRMTLAQASIAIQAAGGVGYLWAPWAITRMRAATSALPAVARMVAFLTGRGTAWPGDQSLEVSLAASAPREWISLSGLGFAYPGRDRLVFDGLDLTIKAGRSLAIVGENGAGKTTLIKLICGLLIPDAGRLSIDGHDLVVADRAAWQARIGAIFQDFIRYPFTARDNVEMGRHSTAGDEDSLARSASRAGAGAIIEGLPHGWDTVLAAEFGGVDLSGGQWQRIALARAFYAVERGASVLVLDEPTAQLDVRAEAELFDRFLELTAGLTTILVSHRFSSVRHADRIVVLDRGRVVEDGSHAQLLHRGGLYAEMFNLQAAHFGATPADSGRDGDGVVPGAPNRA